MTALASYPIPVRRIAVATVVLIFHVILIAVLLRSTLSSETQQIAARERISWLVLHPRPTPRPETPKPRTQPSTVRAVARRRVPVVRAAPSTPTDSGEALQGLHLNLFGCAPENLSNLTPEQRSHCAMTMKKPNDNSVDYADHTDRSKSAPLWARRLAKKQSPPLLPCMSPAVASPLYTLYCLGKGVFNGFDLDTMPGYGDPRPPPDHLPNNGDPVDPTKR